MGWIMLLLSVAGFAVAFTTKSAGVLGVGLVIGTIGLVGAFLAWAAARVASRSRPDAALLTDADINALRLSVRKKQAQQSSARPDTQSPES